MSSKRVSFPPSGTRSHRSRDSVRDSGIGSSSSEYAGLGSRPDRMYAAHDYDQRQSVTDLQEALERATKNAEYYKKQCQEMDRANKATHKAQREAEAARKGECDHAEQLQEEIKELNKMYRDLQKRYERLKDDYNLLNEQYTLDTDSLDNNPMVSTSLPVRTKSKHDRNDKQLKDRMKARINPKDEVSSKSSSSHRSTRDRSRAPSTKRGAYIEEVPPTRNYKTTGSSMMQQPAAYSSSVPRTSQPVSASIYHTTGEFTDGDYHAFPLPSEPRGRR